MITAANVDDEVAANVERLGDLRDDGAVHLDVTEFVARVRASESRHEIQSLIEQEVLDRPPFAFANELQLYNEVRSHLEARLGSEPGSIGLVGSAAVGFSIAPDNFSRPLLESSDLDFVVISPRLFDGVWHALLRWGHPIRHRVPKDLDRWFDSRQQEMFWGWLDPEQLRFQGVTRPSCCASLPR